MTKRVRYSQLTHALLSLQLLTVIGFVGWRTGKSVRVLRESNARLQKLTRVMQAQRQEALQQLAASEGNDDASPAGDATADDSVAATAAAAEVGGECDAEQHATGGVAAAGSGSETAADPGVAPETATSAS